MAWNASDGEKSQKVEEKKSFEIEKGAIVGVIVVACVAIAGYFTLMSGKSSAGKTLDPKSAMVDTLISDMGTNIIKSVESSTSVKSSDSNADYERILPDGRIEHKDKNGRIYVAPPKHAERKKAPYAIFEYKSENQIASLIAIEPGEMLFGTMTYDKRFVDDFLKSCNQPIVISPNDSDYVKNLKEQMIQVKIDLRQRMNNGEDICQIMDETRKELQKMATLKYQTAQMVRNEIKANAMSEKDVDAYIDAANKMLEENGVAPLKMNPILRRSLIWTTERNNQ